jgi:GNAT superfamily N-acetyltransferase
MEANLMRAEARMTVRAVRSELRAGDSGAIVALHDRVYRAEFGFDGRFAASVATSIEVALASGWPERGGGVWLVDSGDELGGALALTDEGGGVGRVRWFVLERELRGQGLGRSMLASLLDHARASGMTMLQLETFSALSTAAHLYREAGFRLRWERPTDKWGPPIVYQGYELQLT